MSARRATRTNVGGETPIRSTRSKTPKATKKGQDDENVENVENVEKKEPKKPTTTVRKSAKKSELVLSDDDSDVNGGDGIRVFFDQTPHRGIKQSKNGQNGQSGKIPSSPLQNTNIGELTLSSDTEGETDLFPNHFSRTKNVSQNTFAPATNQGQGQQQLNGPVSKLARSWILIVLLLNLVLMGYYIHHSRSVLDQPQQIIVTPDGVEMVSLNEYQELQKKLNNFQSGEFGTNKFQNLQDENDKLRNDIIFEENKFQNELTKIKEDSSISKSELKTCQTELALSASSLLNCQNEKDTGKEIQNETNKLQLALTKVTADLHAAEKIISDLQKRINHDNTAKIDQDSDEFETNSKSNQIEMEKCLAEIEIQKEQIQNLENNLFPLKNEFKTCTGELDSFKKSHETAQKTLEADVNALNEKDKSISALEIEIQNLKTHCEKAEKDSKKFKNDVESRIKQKDSQLVSLQNEVNILRTEKDNLKCPPVQECPEHEPCKVSEPCEKCEKCEKCENFEKCEICQELPAPCPDLSVLINTITNLEHSMRSVRDEIDTTKETTLELSDRIQNSQHFQLINSPIDSYQNETTNKNNIKYDEFLEYQEQLSHNPDILIRLMISVRYILRTALLPSSLAYIIPSSYTLPPPPPPITQTLPIKILTPIIKLIPSIVMLSIVTVSIVLFQLLLPVAFVSKIFILFLWTLLAGWVFLNHMYLLSSVLFALTALPILSIFFPQLGLNLKKDKHNYTIA